MKKIILKIINKLGYSIIKIPKNSKSLLSKKLSFYKTLTGNYYLPTEAYNDVIATSIKENKIFDENIYNAAKELIRPNSSVLDIGSNFGQMAIMFAELVGKNGKVYAFEAADFVFEILKKNIAANKKNNIEANYGAVHNIDKSFLFFPEPDFNKFSTYGSFGIDYKHNIGRKVPTLTIDSLNIQESISFIKIDIQGGDLFAMEGAINTILKNKMPILFEYEYLFEGEMPHDFQDYVDFVNKINYKFVKVIDGQNYLIMPK